MVETMVMFVIYGLVAMIMIGIGVSQLKSTTPVGFYSGEKPPTKEELTDVSAWNKKHGMMWLLYGIIILITVGIGALMGDSVYTIIPLIGGILVPIILMIRYHKRLEKKYKKNKYF